MDDQLLHTNGFDAEIWRIDAQLWCGRRRRTRTVTATVLWWGLAAASWSVTVMVGLSMALGQPAGSGLVAALVGTVLLGLWAAVRGRRAYLRDRAERGLSIRHLPLVLRLDPAAQLLWPWSDSPKPSPVPLGDVRVVLVATDMDDYIRYGLSLAWPDREVEIFWTQQRTSLDPILATLAEAGVELNG